MSKTVGLIIKKPTSKPKPEPKPKPEQNENKEQ